MFGVSYFQGKTAVVAGAEHPLGRAVCLRLAAFGATVVAIGMQDDALLDLARQAPARIEPLTLTPGRRNVLALLQDAWGTEPLQIYMDFFPILTRTKGGFARSAGLGAALQRGLAAGQAGAVLSVPQVADTDNAEAQARYAGYVALAQRFSRESHPARFVGLSLPVQGASWNAQNCLSAGDMALMLCHPVSRGVSAGSVMAWADAARSPGGGGKRRTSNGNSTVSRA